MAVLLTGAVLAALVLLVYRCTSEQAPANQAWRAGLGAEIFQGAQFRPERRERRALRPAGHGGGRAEHDGEGLGPAAPGRSRHDPHST
jgi:hypothetical protein